MASIDTARLMTMSKPMKNEHAFKGLRGEIEAAALGSDATGALADKSG